MREQDLNNKKTKIISASLIAALILTLGSCGQQVDKLKPKMSTRAESSSVADVIDESSSGDSKGNDESGQADKIDQKDKTDKTDSGADSKTDAADKTDKTDKDTTDQNADKSKAEQVFEQMSLNEKIGQLFIVNPEQIDGYDETVTVYDDTMKDIIKKYPVGGIIQMTSNVEDPEQITKLNKKLQKISKYGLFIAVDEEGGSVARIALDYDFDVTRYSSMYDIGSTGDTEQAKEVGVTIGKYLKSYGFNVDFAPDADVYTNPENTVIGSRAFSSDPQTASDMVSACIDGFHKSNTICAIKHFPGHGDTAEDTHEGGAVVEKNWEELKDCELIPFINSLDKTDMVMVSHISLPNVTEDGLPASLSRQLVTDMLKGELGYQGIVITDSLSMGAISDSYDPAQAAVKAFEAGADILLMPGNLGEAFDGIKEALSTGLISEDRLNESVMKILTLKEKYGII